MPEGLWWVVGLLALGYLLLAAELFVPGGILGVFGFVAVAWGCYEAFEMGLAWGTAAISLSVLVTSAGVYGFFRSRAGRSLVLADPGPRTWKAQEDALDELVGKVGRTLSSLRPAGFAEIEGRRVDVVSDSEFLPSGQTVEVVHVEGNRVVVAAVAAPVAEDADESSKQGSQTV